MSQVVRVMGFAVMLCLWSIGVSAQKVESLNPWETGDRATYKWTMGAKALTIEEEFGSGGGGILAYSQKTAERTYDMRTQMSPMLHLAGPCLSNGQQCSFAPGIAGLELPAEKGRKWTTAFTVTGETFTADVTQERVVDKVEKVKTPAGEFEAFKVNFNGRIKGKDSKGGSFTGKEDGSDWFAVTPSGKLVLVKHVYRNSFGEKAARELQLLAFK